MNYSPACLLAPGCSDVSPRKLETRVKISDLAKRRRLHLAEADALCCSVCVVPLHANVTHTSEEPIQSAQERSFPLAIKSHTLVQPGDSCPERGQANDSCRPFISTPKRPCACAHTFTARSHSLTLQNKRRLCGSRRWLLPLRRGQLIKPPRW